MLLEFGVSFAIRLSATLEAGRPVLVFADPVEPPGERAVFPG